MEHLVPRESPPLGFVLLLGDEVDAATRLVNRLWRAQHAFVLHADAKVGAGVRTPDFVN